MLQIAGFILPYIAVAIGIFVFHNAWPAILIYHAGIVALILLSKKRIPVARLFMSESRKIPFIMASVGASGGILLYFLWPFLAIGGQIGEYMRSIGLVEQAWPLFIVYFILVNALLEEYFWRGLLNDGSRRVSLNDVFFSGYHVPVLVGAIGFVWVVPIFVVLSLFGWLWRQVNRLNEGLLPSVACHVTADVSVMLAAYLRTR